MMVQRRLLRLVRYARLPFALTVTAGVAAAGAAVTGGLALADALGEVMAGGADFGGALSLAAAMIVGRLGLLWLRDVCATWTAARVKIRLRAALLERLFDLGPGLTVRRRAGDLQATIVDGVEALQAYVGFYLPQAIISVAVPAVLIGYLAALDPVVATVVAVGVIVVPLARRVWGRILGESGSRHWEMYEEYAAKTTDAIHGMSTLVALGASSRHGEHLAREAEELRRATTRNLAASLGVSTVTNTAMGVGTSLAVALAAFRGALGLLDAAAVLIVLFITAECFRPLTDLQNYWHEGFYGLAAANGIFSILDARPDVVDPADPVDVHHDGPPSIRFEDVSFSYPDSDRVALRGIDLFIPGGATVAVVGRSGAGKTTLTQLVQRVFDPVAGSIQIEGVDLRRLSIGAIRSKIAVVSQEIVLFHGTIRDNILMANPNVDERTLSEVIAAAGLDEVVCRLPDGLDSQVGERGARLSGGERQRVAIARALLADAPILILDEATSSLDGANEARISDALSSLRDGRTTIVVAHRLSTVADADLVAVLDEGRLVEMGEPAELERSGGHWAGLVARHRAAVAT
jgi:ATP-binding cassette, subfamily C, bacterial CydD